jgi:tRNA-dihydrouridine synthase B
MRRVIKSVVDNTALPVTVKTRLGWDRNSIQIVDVARMVEDVGAVALAVHCRTRDQGHEGLVSWEYIERMKEAVSIPIILNGDVRSPQDVKRAFDTGADAVMIGRAAIANPWIFRDAHAFLETGIVPESPDMEERIAVGLEHLENSIEYKGDHYGVIEFRKYWSGYLKGLPLASHARRDLVVAESRDEILERLHQYRLDVAEHLETQRHRRESFRQESERAVA